jgi:hypothetical protein
MLFALIAQSVRELLDGWSRISGTGGLLFATASEYIPEATESATLSW